MSEKSNLSHSILFGLQDSRYYTVREIAHMVYGDSNNVRDLLEVLLEEERVIRKIHRDRAYYKINDSNIDFKYHDKPKIRKPRYIALTKDVQNARTCYAHLAGKLGVGLTKAMIDLDYLRQERSDFLVTEGGRAFLGDLGIDISKFKEEPPHYAPLCLDTSERQYHIGGILGQKIAEIFFDLGWIIRKSDKRAIYVTDKGRGGFRRYFGMEVEKYGECDM